MSARLVVKSHDPAVRTRREAAVDRVLAHFGNPFPSCRLLCFFDDEDWRALRKAQGPANRGFYTPGRTSRPPCWAEAPHYLKGYIAFDGQHACDDFIYLYGSTCVREEGLTMTFAHEMQHFVQHASVPALWAANSLIHNLPKRVIAALALTWCDIPHEREARIVSKRTAECLLGAEATRRYIDAKIAERVTNDDAADWQFIRDLDTSTPYDLARETGLFFPRLRDYKSELEGVREELAVDDPIFSCVDLDVLLGGLHG